MQIITEKIKISANLLNWVKSFGFILFLRSFIYYKVA